MSDTPTPKFRIRRWQFWLGGLCLGAFLFLVLLPLGMKYSLAWWLADKTGAEISIEDIDLNLFTGRASLSLLEGSGLEQALIIGDSRLDFNWWPLTQKRLLLPELHIRGLVIDVQREADGTLRIGGLSIPPAETEPATAGEEDPSNWGIGCQSLHLENIELRYRDPELKFQLLIERLDLKDLYSWQPDQPATLTGEFVLNGGRFDIDLQSTPFAETPALSGTLAIAKLPLDWSLPLLRKSGVDQLSSTLSSQFDLNLRLNADGQPEVKLQGKLQLDDLDLGLTAPPLQIQQQTLAWQGSLTLNTAEGMQISGELNGSQLQVSDRETGMSALRLENFAIASLLVDDANRIKAGEITLHRAKLLQLTAGDPEAHLLNLQQLSLSGLEIRDLKQLNVDKLVLAGLDTTIILDKNGALAGSSWWQSPAAEPAEVQPETVSAKADPFAFRIGGIEINGQSRLGFIDRGPNTPVTLELTRLDINLGTLDSNAPEQPSAFKLSSELDRYSRLEIAGQVQPLLATPGLQLEGELQGLNLSNLNPYIVEVLQSRILSGQATADIAVTLQENRLEAVIELTLAQLETAASRAFDRGRKKPPGSLANMPLNLIKNRNGDVELDLKIEGDLNSPEFNTTSLIQQAMLTAVGKAMTASLAPLGIQLLTGAILPPGSTMLASVLYDMMTKINIPPMTFSPLESELSSATAGQIDTLEKLLQDRPRLQLRLCGMASHTDLNAIQQRELVTWKAAQKKHKGGAPKEPPAKLSEAQAGYIAFQNELLELALKRADSIKAQLVEKRGIEPGRLFLCDPDIDITESGESRVDIRL